MASVPVQPPPAVQDVAFVLDQVRVEALPEAIVVGLAVSVTVGAAGAAVTVKVAIAPVVLSATEVAVRVTALGEGAFAGAAYMTDVDVMFERVPHVMPLQPVPERLQVTPMFCESFVSVAVKVCVPIPAWTFAAIGRTVTTMGGGNVDEPPDPQPVMVHTTAVSRPAYNFSRCLRLGPVECICFVLPECCVHRWGCQGSLKCGWIFRDDWMQRTVVVHIRRTKAKEENNI
jgi:hypothetical protein